MTDVNNHTTDCIKVNVQYHSRIGPEQEIQFSLDPNVPLNITIGQLVQAFNAAGQATVYVLNEFTPNAKQQSKAITQVRC